MATSRRDGSGIQSWSAVRAPGVAVAVGLAVAAWLAARILDALGVHVIEPLVLALIAGMLIRLAWRPPRRLAAGLSFASKGLLEFAIVLLGATLNFVDLGSAGLRLIVYAVIVVAVVLGAGILIGRRLGLSARLAALVGVGNAICGNSAIAAVAPIIRATSQEVAAAIALTAALSVGVVLLLPLAAPIFGLSNTQYGVLAGLNVYAVPQVVAASFAVSPQSGSIGSLVKLLRVLLLGPVVAGAALLMARRDRVAVSAERKPVSLTTFVPWFVAGFLVLALLRTVGVLPSSLGDPLQQVSRLLTIVAMAALGLSVDLASVRKTGRGVALLVLTLTLLSLALGLVLVMVGGV